MNSIVKSFIERALVGTGASRLAMRRQPRDAALILAYHNIVPDNVFSRGDGSLHLARGEFARQLDVLQSTHAVVSLESLLEGELSSNRRKVAITFDDAYVGAMTMGIEELAARQLPATVFVAPGLLGRIPWWDAVARSSNLGLEASVREHALHSLAGRHDQIIQWRDIDEQLPVTIDATERIATLDQLLIASKYDRLTLAAHTWSHPNLTALTATELLDELTRPWPWLQSHFSSTIRILSYPYGLYTDRVAEAAAAAGYSAALRVDGGWHSHSSLDMLLYRIPRYNVPSGLSIDGFRLRLAALGTQ